MHTVTQATPIPSSPAPRPLVRWGSLAAVAAPVAALIAIAIGAPVYADDLSDSAGTSRFLVANAVTLCVLLLLAVALVGLYVRGEQRLGRTGQVGFLIALVGTILAAGGAWDSLFAVPWVAERSPEVLDVSTGGSLLAGFVISYLVLVAGWILFATANLRARLVRRSAALVLVVGSVLAILPAPTALRLLPLAVGAALVSKRRAG